jgi:hypothetical protein
MTQSKEDRFVRSPFMASSAVKNAQETVAQGKPSIKYARGVAKKWKAAGRIVHSTKAYTAREEVFVRKSQEAANRTRKGEEIETQYKARLMTEQKLTECAPGLLSLWQNELEVEADREKIHPMVRESETGWAASYVSTPGSPRDPSAELWDTTEGREPPDLPSRNLPI